MSDNFATVTSLSHAPPPFTRHAHCAIAVVIAGPDRGNTCRIEPGRVVRVGVSDDADLRLTDESVSRQHVEITWRDGVVTVTDVGSKNGTFVANLQVETANLGYGDVFRIGHTELKLIPAEQAIEPEVGNQLRFGQLVGASAAMRRLYALINQVASSDVPVLIEGETGVGKELVAEAIHQRSRRRDNSFAVFDCGAVPENLIESTLFGHVKGAFSGANADQRGVFDEADGGTVFLDEIGELRSSLQPALLRVVDRGQARAVGAPSYRDVDVRIIAATHRNLAELIRERRFREDLYYRLAVIRVVVPALRERIEDIPLLIRHFLQRAGTPHLRVSPASIDSLRDHDWPGNVRELRNLVQRSVVLSQGDELHLLPPRGVLHAAPSAVTAGGELRPYREGKADALVAFERAYLSDLITRFDRLAPAAKAAGMDRHHLSTLLKRHGLKL